MTPSPTWSRNHRTSNNLSQLKPAQLFQNQQTTFQTFVPDKPNYQITKQQTTTLTNFKNQFNDIQNTKAAFHNKNSQGHFKIPANHTAFNLKPKHQPHDTTIHNTIPSVK